MDFLLEPATLISLISLVAMEIVLGIDNIVFISILVDRLPVADQKKARFIGIGLALVLRLGLLFAISWIMQLTTPLFTLLDKEISGRHLILLAGGLFLVAKSTHEIYDKLEASHEDARKKGAASFYWILMQILLLDLVFSLDSVITAVGMVSHISIMVIAMLAAVFVMLVFAGKISRFVNKHPSMKILALSFLLLIGVMLIAEGFGEHINKGYIYFAMAFSMLVELFNMRYHKNQKPVVLHNTVEEK